MKKPKRRTKEMVLCASCKSPIHIDDLGMIDKNGLWHKECLFSILYLNPDKFLTGMEVKIKEKSLGGRKR